MSGPRIGLVGTGRLAGLLLRALSRHLPTAELLLGGRNPDRLDELQREIPALAVMEPEAVAERTDFLVLCVPPEAYGEVLSGLAARLKPDAIVVSVTNGVPLEAIGALVRNPVIKVILTVAQTVRRGVSLVVAGPNAGPHHVAAVTSLLAAFSKPVTIEDRDSRVASNLAGSWLALHAAICEGFLRANQARAGNLDRETLLAMMNETLAAAAELARQGVGFGEIIASTATPGGTTEAALHVLEAEFPALAVRMVEATFERQARLQLAEPEPD